MNYESAKKYLQSIGQEQLLEYYGELTDDERSQLLADISKTDFGVLNNINTSGEKSQGAISPIDSLSLTEIEQNRERFVREGLKVLSEGKVAALLLAGGQGTRLGFDKPKGMFDMGITRHLPIFKILMDRMSDAANCAGRYFPLFIMTSALNDGQTQKFFKDNGYFGYPKEFVHFYVQEEAPACSYNGKVFLDKKHRVALSPDGNGGWYSSLTSSGLSSVLKEQGIEWINLFGVDNVLQRICDPVFIGATVLKNCGCGAKVVNKVSPEEKVGVMCKENGLPTVIEYYEMTEELKNERKNGELVYRHGVILNYLFNIRALDSVVNGKLPYHLAEKAIPHMENGERITPSKPCGYKFEKLVVDMVKLMGSGIAFEVEREREFAPVKNATGTDSVETARELLIKNGVKL